jgi:hypothetical protein
LLSGSFLFVEAASIGRTPFVATSEYPIGAPTLSTREPEPELLFLVKPKSLYIFLVGAAGDPSENPGSSQQSMIQILPASSSDLVVTAKNGSGRITS